MNTDSKFYQNKPLNLLLIANSTVCICILLTRVFITGKTSFLFLIWNLFLAWLPFIFSTWIAKVNEQKGGNFKLSILFLVWLLFFPNAPYILTDLFHFRQRGMVPLWFDLILILSFAWNGLMLGFISLMKIQQFLNAKFGTRIGFLFVFALLILCAFGMYLGRYMRWNSWDILTNPSALLADVGDRFVNPSDHPQTLGITVSFSGFLIMSYSTLYFMIKPYRKPDSE